MSNPNVKSGAKAPKAKLANRAGHQHVAQGKKAIQTVSAGKMASGSGVTLGTSHGNTNPSHAL